MMHQGIFNRAFGNRSSIAKAVAGVLLIFLIALLPLQKIHAVDNAAANLASSSGPIVSSGGMGLVPCDGPECNLDSVLQLMNNLMTFFFTYLLTPIFVIMVMYLGYSYLTAQGNPGQHAKLVKMLKNMILGLLLILCAWLIVRTVLSVLGYSDDLFFFGK